MAIRAGMDSEEEGQTVTWEQVKAESVLDRVSRELVMVIKEGFPVHRNKLEEVIKPFFGMKEELYEVDGVPFLHGRMQAEVLVARYECCSGPREGPVPPLQRATAENL